MVTDMLFGDDLADTRDRLTAADDVRSFPLVALRHLGSAELSLYMATVEMVASARQAGASWAEVGRALEMSRQAAWEKYSGRLN